MAFNSEQSPTKFAQFWNLLFFKEDPEVADELDEVIWQRVRIYMYTTAALVSIWGVFDFFIDYENLWTFLTLRAIYTPITLLCAYFFHIHFFKSRHRAWALAHYLLLILDIGIMVLWTDNFVKYLIGFSTIFWGASVIMLWRFWNTVIPGLVVILIAFARFYYFPHNVPTSELITGLYYFMTCLAFTSIISAYGYHSAYLLAEKNLTLRKTQDKLVQAEKMASMNLMIASVAHEINTPVGTALTAVSHVDEQLHQILDALEVGEVTLDQLEIPAKDGLVSASAALTELKRTTRLVERFKEAAVDQSSYERRKFNLPKYLEENILQASMQPILKRVNVEIEVVSNDDIIIDSFPGEYSQIFTNLIINSITHGFDGKELVKDAGEINILITKVKNNEIAIRYRDNGKGMNDEVLSKIFDPFFTTKGTEDSSEGRGQRGSGLGMTIVYNIVTQKLGGKIEAFSQLGLGAEFIMLLPTIK